MTMTTLATLLEDKKKEFDELMKTPEVLKHMTHQTCMVCGQPYDKSQQVQKLWESLTSAITEACTALRDVMTLEEKEKVHRGHSCSVCNKVPGHNSYRSESLKRAEEFLSE